LDNAAIVNDTLKRYATARGHKQLWEPLYRDALDYLAPHRQQFNMQTPGSEKTNPDRVFDSTAISAMDDFVSNLISAIAPHRREWMTLKPGSLVKTENKDAAARQLQDITQVFFDYLHASNFHTEFAASLYDYGIGTAALLIAKGDQEKPFRFQAVPISELFLEQGPQGRVDTSFRCLKDSGRNVSQLWADADIPDSLQKTFDDNPDTEHEFVEASLYGQYDFPVTDNEGNLIRQKRWGYRYVVIHQATKTLLVNRVQRSTPWVVFRWSVMPGEIYGRGPALKALPDIKSINVTKNLLLKGANRAILGIWVANDDGIVNFETLQTLQPGAVIPVDFTGGDRAGLAELPFNGNVSLGQFVFNDMQIAIKRMMFSEPLGRVDLPVKSVYELQSRQQEWAKRIGASFSRMEYEGLIPLINRCLYILNELGLIDMGEFLVDGVVTGVSFVSPLSQSQELEALQAMQAYVTYMLQTLGPQMGMAMFKPDVLAPLMARLLNIPMELIPSTEEFNVMKQALAQQTALQSQAQTQDVLMQQQQMQQQAEGITNGAA
jgi:hypothetical protein